MKKGLGVVAVMLSVLLGSVAGVEPASAASNNSASIWYVSGGVQPNGWALCRTTVTHQNTIYGTSTQYQEANVNHTWNYNLWFPHGTVKNGSGVRYELTYYTNTDYYCLNKTARANQSGSIQSPLLVVLNLFNGYTSNFGNNGAYNTPGNYSGIVSSPYLHAGYTYCSSSC